MTWAFAHASIFLPYNIFNFLLGTPMKPLNQKTALDADSYATI
ncbi:MAG TPA: hypothetical protein VIM88_01170 [Sulfurovum sp.]